jgi:hypothetical protein
VKTVDPKKHFREHEEEVKAQDLRRASLHEAGHAIVSCHFRIACEAIVMPNTDNPGWEQKHFTGKTQPVIVATTIEEMLAAGGTPYERAVIGWAGVIAEHKAEAEADFCPEWLFESCYDDPDALSPSDLRHIEGCNHRRPYTIFCKAVAIVETHWPQVTRFADQLSNNIGTWLTPLF